MGTERDKLIRKATTYIKSLNATPWNSSIKFECQSPECSGNVTNQNSGIYLPQYGRVFCWQPSCSFSKDAASSHKSHDVIKYIAVCNGAQYDTSALTSGSFRKVKELLEMYPEDHAIYTTKKKTKKTDTEYKKIKMPILQVPINNLFGDERAIAYVKSRGFDPDWLWNEFKITYVVQDSWLNKYQNYKGYLIIPFFTEIGQIYYYQARDYLNRKGKSKHNPDGILRWMNPLDDVVNIGKSDVLFNGHLLHKYKKVYLFESIFDTIEMCKNNDDILKVGLNGSSISEGQLNLLKNSNIEELTVIMDGGAFLASIKIAEQLLKLKNDPTCTLSKLNIVPLPMVIGSDGIKKDANEFGVSFMYQYIPSNTIEVTQLRLRLLKLNLYKFKGNTFKNKSYIIT